MSQPCSFQSECLVYIASELREIKHNLSAYDLAFRSLYYISNTLYIAGSILIFTFIFYCIRSFRRMPLTFNWRNLLTDLIATSRLREHLSHLHLDSDSRRSEFQITHESELIRLGPEEANCLTTGASALQSYAHMNSPPLGLSPSLRGDTSYHLAEDHTCYDFEVSQCAVNSVISASDLIIDQPDHIALSMCDTLNSVEKEVHVIGMISEGSLEVV